jgi:hypothetical protein
MDIEFAEAIKRVKRFEEHAVGSTLEIAAMLLIATLLEQIRGELADMRLNRGAE